MSENGLRETIEDAFQQENVENEVKEVQNDPAPAPVDETPAPADVSAEGGEDKPTRDYVRDQLGKFAPKEEATAKPVEAKPVEQKAQGVKAGPKVGEPTAQRAPEDEPLRMSTEKPPAAWRPEARETWSQIPQTAREEIMRQTQLVHDTLNRTKDQRKFAEVVQQVVSPYRNIIESSGTTVIGAINELLQTAHVLKTGQESDKAQTIARIIKLHNVDVAALDRALVGEMPAGVNPEVARVKQQFEQELAPLRQMQQQMLQQQQYEAQQRQSFAEQKIQEFEASQPEFLADVAQDMAHILDVGAQRGVEYTLEQAYELACRAHPEINRILQQREQTNLAQNMNKTVSKAKQAAVSLGGAPSLGVDDGRAPDSVRDAIMLAMNQGAR